MKAIFSPSFLLLTAAILAFSPHQTQAQVCQKGAMMIGGSGGFNSFKAEDEDAETFFTLNPGFGYFIANNMALGANINFTTGEDITSIGASPFFRAFVYDKLFLQANFTLLYLDFDSDNETLIRFGGGAGYSIFLNEVVAIEPMVTFSAGDFVLDSEIGLFGIDENFRDVSRSLKSS